MAGDKMLPTKRCSKCGVEKGLSAFHPRKQSKDGRQYRCKECQVLIHKEWRRSHPEKMAEYGQRYKQRQSCYDALHAARIAARKAAYYLAFPGKKAEKSARDKCRREADIERNRLRSRLWQQDNKDRSRHNVAAWRRTNPEAWVAQMNNRRARQASAEGKHTKAELQQILAAQGFKCANPCCDADLRVVKRTLDHRQALSLGGSNDPANLQWLCKSCNSRKNVLSMDVWLARERLRHATAS